MADEHSQFMVFYKHGHTWYNPKRLGAPQVRILRKWGRTWEFRAASFLNKAACFWNCPRNWPGRYILDIYNYIYICIYDPTGPFKGSMQWPIICDVWCPLVLVIHLNSCHFRCWISEICTHPTCIFAVFLLLLLPKIEKKGSCWIYHDLSPVVTTKYNKCRFNKFQYTYDMS